MLDILIVSLKNNFLNELKLLRIQLDYAIREKYLMTISEDEN